MSLLTVVPDTNIFVSGTILSYGIPFEILGSWRRQEFILVTDNYEVRGVSSDPDDDKFLACALEARADYIVTGDPDLLFLKYYHVVNILNPRDFLENLILSQTITE